MYETTTRVELPGQGRSEVPHPEVEGETVTTYEVEPEIVEPGQKVSKSKLAEHGQSDDDIKSMIERGALKEA